jgi:hypothetical protein
MCVPSKIWNITREPLLVEVYLIIRHQYSKEASHPQRKQLLPLVLKEAISKEAIPKEAIPKEAILNAPTSFHPSPLRMRTTVHTIKYRRTHTMYTEENRITHELSVFTHLYYCSKYWYLL